MSLDPSGNNADSIKHICLFCQRIEVPYGYCSHRPGAGDFSSFMEPLHDLLAKLRIQFLAFFQFEESARPCLAHALYIDVCIKLGVGSQAFSTSA
ncbi:hypothetical protein ACLKA6_018693 [Drosophila palustris]